MHLILAVKADAAYCPPQPVVTDEPHLIERLRAGDRAALEQMIHQHQQPIARLVSRLTGWSNETDDLVQEVFVAAMKAIRRFEGGSRLNTWLTRIAINTCRQHHRTRLLRAKYWKKWMSDATEAVQEDASQSAEQRERVQAVSETVRRLKSTYREVVVLHYLEGMEIEQITQVLGVSRPAIEVRLHRARKMLEVMLKKA